MPRVIIVGGGISGLAVAHYLIRGGGDVDILLVEGEGRLGGTMGSDIDEGFVFERGPNGFLDNVPHTLELAGELGLDERLRRAEPASRDRFIYKRGRLLALPAGPGAFLRSPILSLRGRLSVCMEPFRPKRTDGVEESVAGFGRRRLGEEFVRRFLDPLVTGIYAGDVERLSLPASFPKIAALEQEHGSLIRAMWERRRAAKAAGAAASRGGPAGPGGELCSFPGGLGELVDALAGEIGERARLRWKASDVRRQDGQYAVEGSDGSVEKADGVVLAVPAYRAASLLAAAEPETARALEAIAYAPIAVACYGFPREAVKGSLAGFGFLVPRDQGLRILGVIWVSSIFPEQAPEGMVSLRCMVGGARDPDVINLSEEHLLELALEEIRPILQIEGKPAVRRLYRYARGIPQYNVGHAGRVERIERLLWDLPGLFITGNAYHGIGVNDCVREGKRKARAVVEYFRK